jgi:hypothetical protein
VGAAALTVDETAALKDAYGLTQYFPANLVSLTQLIFSAHPRHPVRLCTGQLECQSARQLVRATSIDWKLCRSLTVCSRLPIIVGSIPGDSTLESTQAGGE